MLWKFLKNYSSLVIWNMLCSVMAAFHVWAAIYTGLDAWTVTAIIMITANTVQWYLLFRIWQNPIP